MDSFSYTIALVTIEADDEPPVYLTNYEQNIIIDGSLYIGSPELTLDLPDKSGAINTSEGTIKELTTDSASPLANMAGGYPYNQIEVTVDEVFLDDSLTPLFTRRHFTGLVYQAKPKVASGRLDLIVKDWKYYTDVTGGMPCTEYCFVKHFGDAVCQATVVEYPVTIDSVSGYDATVVAAPVVQDFLFNKGYFKLGGTSIKVKYWESGDTFQTAQAMPSSWVGQSVLLVAGCDKTLDTCRTIHNNEEHFSGWGYSMVDYDPQHEVPNK